MSAKDHMAQRAFEKAVIDLKDHPEQEGVLESSDLYDSEKIAISKVSTALMDNINKHRELGAFQREVRERYAEIGFVARCDFYESQYEDHLPKSERTQYPEITLIRRCEPTGEFDHDKMGHEVRSNILGVKGQDSVQKTHVAGGFTTPSGLIVPGK